MSTARVTRDRHSSRWPLTSRSSEQCGRTLTLFLGFTLALASSLAIAPQAVAAFEFAPTNRLAPPSDYRANAKVLAGPSQDQSWIDASYQLFLGRSASRNELSSGEATIATRGRLALSESLATSPEWAGVVIDGLFQDALDRHPDPSGRTYWVNRLGQGSRTRDISVSIFGSPEAQSRSATNSAYVGDLYGRILGRSPESVGLHYWSSRLDQGTPAWEIVNGLWDSSEFRNTRVRTTYEQVLGRLPDELGQDYWAGRLLDIDEVRLAAFLSASDEFYESVNPLAALPDPDPNPDSNIPRVVPDHQSLNDLIGLLRVEPEGISTYHRSDWKHWSDLDDDGCNTRCQVTKDEWLPTVHEGGGGYLSFYDNTTFGPNEDGMHLDHVVALAEAHRSGGATWPADKKQQFANDLGWDGSLRLVSATTNLSKSSRDPAQWMPPAALQNPEVGCTYLRDWVGGKYRWDLAVDETERLAILASAVSLGCLGS